MMNVEIFKNEWNKSKPVFWLTLETFRQKKSIKILFFVMFFPWLIQLILVLMDPAITVIQRVGPYEVYISNGFGRISIS